MVMHGPLRSSLPAAVPTAALLASALLLSGCGKSKTDTPPPTTVTLLDTHKVALSIKASILAQKGVRAHVVCPPTITQAKGMNFVCTATVLKATKKVPKGTTQFAVQQTTDSGQVTYAAAQTTAATTAK
jgi:hypothetical protein